VLTLALVFNFRIEKKSKGYIKVNQKNMRVKVIFLFLSLVSFSSFCQKFGYIDTEYIINKMPEFKNANDLMNQFTDKWSKDIESKYVEVGKMKDKFQQEEILLTADMKKDQLAEIQKKEDELRTLNNSVFGINGLLFQKKKEILKPIMDELYKTSEKVARKYKLSFIFDKASDMSMTYADPRHDYTDFVLEELGLSQKKNK
jgi:outer membrane protein